MPLTDAHLFSAFQKSASEHSNRIAVTFSQGHEFQSVSYRDLLNETLRLADILKGAGLIPGDRVLIILDHPRFFAPAFWAVMSHNAVSVPIDPQFHAEQVQHIARHCGARLVLLNGNLKALFPPVPDGPRVLVLDDPDFQVRLESRPVPDAVQQDGDTLAEGREGELAVIFYTSGTTDLPKGVMLTHQNLLSNYAAVLSYGFLSSRDVILAILPLHHAYAFTATLLAPILAGAQVVYPAGLTSLDLLNAMKKNRVTIFVGVPQVFAMLERSVKGRLKSVPAALRLALRALTPAAEWVTRITGFNVSKLLYGRVHRAFGGCLRFFVSGGAKLDVAVARTLVSWGVPVLEGYGLTETSPVAAFNPAGRARLGSVGLPVPGCEIRIEQPDAQGVGEVLIKGPNVMKGYYDLPGPTDDVLKDGWFRTGDLGYIDSEGYLFLVGRKKELIVLSNGKNIVPEDVESVYSRIPFIRELGVLASREGVFLNGTDHLVAVVVIDAERFRRENVSTIRDRLRWEMENVSAQLPTYQRIRGFVVSQEPLPRTRLGKIKRYQLEAIYAVLSKVGSRLDDPSEAPSPGQPFDQLSRRAFAFFKETLHKDVNLKDHLELDLGLDSLGRIEMLMNLQERLGLDLNDDEAMDFFMCTTVQDLLDQLKKIIPSAAGEAKDEKAMSWDKVLGEPPQEETAKKIQLVFGFFSTVFNLLLMTFFKLFFGVLFWLRAKGVENLPAKGPYLICPNHTSYLDGLFVLAALPYRVALQTYFVGYSQFFESAVLRPFVRIARLIPLEVSYNLVESLRACAHVLRHEKILCYFPEGQRSIDGEVTRFKKGVGILVYELDIPVIPVYLDGAFRTWPRTRRTPRLARVKVCFAPPVFRQDLLPKEDSGPGIYDAIAERLQGEVASFKRKCLNISPLS